MGSCFRWKKKNSYTVNHDEEYSASGGKYNPQREPWSVTAAAGTGRVADTNSAAKKWAAESRVDVVGRNDHVTNDHVTNDNAANDNAVRVADEHAKPKGGQTGGADDQLGRRDPEQIKENGCHGGDAGRSIGRGAPEENDRSSFPVASSEHSSDKDETVGRYEEADVSADVDTGERPSDWYEPVAVRSDSPTVDEVAVAARSGSASDVGEVVDEAAYEGRAEAGSPANAPEIGVDVCVTHVGEDEQQEESVLEREEDYFAGQDARLGEEPPTEPRHEDVSEASPAPDAYAFTEVDDEVQFSNSPAGTWDARLNKDVRAELDDVQRSGEGSRTNSTASLDRRSEQDAADPDAAGPAAPVVQRVQFDLPLADGDRERPDGVSVIAIGGDTYRTDETETGHPERASGRRAAADDDVDVLLSDGGSAFQRQAGDVLGEDEGAIVLTDESAVSYEEPYAAGQQTDVRAGVAS